MVGRLGRPSSAGRHLFDARLGLLCEVDLGLDIHIPIVFVRLAGMIVMS